MAPFRPHTLPSLPRAEEEGRVAHMKLRLG